MESMESHEAGFPPFPHSLEIPSGFPHSHGLDDWIYVFYNPLNSNHRHRKGLVTDVSGPQRNACPGTLAHAMHQRRIPGGPHADHLGKLRRVAGKGDTMQAFVPPIVLRDA